MTFANAMIIVGGGVLLWLLLVQPLLKQRAEVAPLEAEVADRGLGFFSRLRVRLKGLKTKLVSRLVVLAGVLISAHDVFAPALAGFHWQKIIPPQYLEFWPLVIIVLGVLFEQLRNATSTPPGVAELPKDIESKPPAPPPGI